MQEKLIERYGVGVVRRGGLRIRTTIDPKLQEDARNAVNAYYADPAGPSSAIVSIDPANGKIRAMASTGSYADSNFNLAAQGHRQPGSAFKTFVLTAAIRKGVDPELHLLHVEATRHQRPDIRPLGGQDLREQLHRHGQPDARDAVLRQHRVRAADPRPRAEGGCDTAKLLGITTKLDCYPAEGLGGLTLGVTPLEMADAYATLASGGVRHRPTGIEKVVFPDGKSEDLANSQASAS